MLLDDVDRAIAELADLLTRIEACDPSQAPDGPERTYVHRNALVAQAVGAARRAGLAVGLDRDPTDAERPDVIFVGLPTGQVSWHVPADVIPADLPAWPHGYDGHTHAHKTARIAAYCAGVRNGGQPDALAADGYTITGGIRQDGATVTARGTRAGVGVSDVTSRTGPR